LPVSFAAAAAARALDSGGAIGSVESSVTFAEVPRDSILDFGERRVVGGTGFLGGSGEVGYALTESG